MPLVTNLVLFYAEKTIHEEESSNVDVAEMMADLKVALYISDTGILKLKPSSKNKLEIQYAAKRDALLSEVLDLKQQLETKSNEVRNLNASIDSLKSVNEELKVHYSFLLSCQALNRSLACICCDICRN
jgi:kinesin family protein 5